MRAVASISQHPVAALAVGEVAGATLEQLGGDPVSLLVVFVDGSHTGAIDDISSALHELLSPDVMVGTTAVGIIGQDSEVEDSPAISVWAGTGITAEPVRVEAGKTSPLGGWPTAPEETESHVVLLADPFSTPVEEMFADAALRTPALRIHGGLSSAARALGGNRLLLDREIYSNGAVGVALRDTPVRSVVSQGCRPVGNPYTVTGCAGNVITELASQRPLDVLEDVARRASPEDQQLLAGGIHIGLVMNERQIEEFDRGDFLIRSVIGADPESGAIAVGAAMEIGTTVQFQVRDAKSATEDLMAMLTTTDGSDAMAALTFTCNGRGTHLFGRSGHDAELIHEISGSHATAGMFCAGEFGPVGAANHLHGFTASTLLFK